MKLAHAALFHPELSSHPNMIQYLFNYGALQGEGLLHPSRRAHFNVGGGDGISAGSCALCSVKEQYVALKRCAVAH